MLLKLITFFLLISSIAQASDDKNIQSILSILPFNKKSVSTIKTEKCNIQKDKWVSLLLTHEEFVEEIKYNSNCQLQGKFKVKFNKDFPVKLDIKNTEIKKLDANMFINIEFREKPYLVIKLKRSKLISKKGDIKFDYHHEFQIDPFANPPIQKDLGAKITINSNGKKMTKKMAP